MRPAAVGGIWTALVLGAALISLSACGSDDSAFGSSAPDPVASSGPTSPPPSPAPGSLAIAQKDVADYVATDDGGDEVEVQVSLGTPSLASQSGFSAVSACADRVSSLSRAVVIPVVYDATIRSSLSGDLHLGYGSTGGVVDQGQFDELSPQFWAVTYRDDGDQCANPQDYDSPVGGGTWRDAEPGASKRLFAVVIAEGVITPNSSDPEDFAKTVLFDAPTVQVGQDDLDVTSRSGTNVVTCGASGTDPAAGGQFSYVAVDPTTATSAGCTQ